MSNFFARFDNKSAIVRFCIFSLFSFAVMVLIFYFSAQDATKSSSQSGSIIKIIAQIINPGFNKLDEASKKAIMKSLQFFVRKFAHFAVYAALGFFVFSAVVNVNVAKKRLYYFIPAAVCLFYSLTDEIHQAFIPGRACRIFDIFVDFAGSNAGILVVYVFLVIINRIKRNNMLKK